MKQNGIVNNGKSSGRNSRFLATQQMLHRVVAIFVMALVCGEVWAATYTATVTPEVTPKGSGTVTIDGSDKMVTKQAKSSNNFTLTIVATPATGYQFKEWQITVPTGGKGTIANKSESTTTITVSANKSNDIRAYTIKAVFEEIPKSTFYYSIVANLSSGSPATSGSVTPSSAYTGSVQTFESSGSAKYTVTAEAKTDYEFVGWSTANNESSYISGAGASYEYTINNITGTSSTSPNPQVTLYAHFRELPLVYFKATAVAVPAGGGTVSASVTDNSKHASSSTNPSATTTATYTVTSTADGYYFIGWSDTEGGEIKSTAKSYTKTITATSTSSSSPTETKAYANFKTEPTGITVSPTSMELGVGGTQKITVTLTPSGAYENITYTSSDNTKATVAADGTVTGVAAGTATITVTAKKSDNTTNADLTKTVAVTVKEQVATPVILFAPIDDGATATATITCATEGAVIYYTINGSDPTPPSSAKKNGTKSLTPATGTLTYSDPFTVQNGDQVRAIATKAGNYISSILASSLYSPKKVPTPTINIAKGQVTFSCEEPGVTFYYTTDGTTTPTTASSSWQVGDSPVIGVNEKNIQVIAVKSGFSNSEVATKLYIAGSGVSGTTVILNDYEDHSMTYYQATVTDAADAQYPSQLLSPAPKDVKITYNGGSVTNASAVAVSSTESANTFIYYKTIEKKAWGDSEGRWLTGDYAYKVIPNPFSKRPATGTGTSKVYYGFGGWKIKDGGEYINGHNDGDVLGLEEKINFASTMPEYGAEIEFEATWVTAKVAKDGTTGLSGGTYETNFVVFTGDGNKTVNYNVPATVSNQYPDGTAAGTATVTSYTSNADLKLEYIKIGNSDINSAGTGTFTAAANGQLIVGRGCTGKVQYVYGGSGQNRMRIESGVYGYIHPMQGQSTNNNNYSQIVFGCDYDRATNDGLTSNDQYLDNSEHRRLRVINFVGANGAGTHNNSDTSEFFDINIKSGYFGYSADYSKISSTSNRDGWGLGYGGNTDQSSDYVAPDATGTSRTYRLSGNVPQTTMSFYVGRTRGGDYGGVNRVLIEGGELGSINGGGYRNNGNSTSSTLTNNNHLDGPICYHLRVKGGWIKGAAYGTASSSTTYANIKLVFTGGEINGWVAGACNGTDFNNNGENYGNIFIYMGGTAELRSHKRDGVYNNAWGYIGGVEGGSIYASGRGRDTDGGNGHDHCGSSIVTNVVVADESYIERNVCGGGYFGVAQESHMYITGGTVDGGIYGGAWGPISNNDTWLCQNTYINMYGGLMKGNIYGGNYGGKNTAAAIQKNANVNIYGGQVGTDVTHTANVYGGGEGSGTNINQNVTVTIGKSSTEGPTIFGDVYGGSAKGKVNGTTVTTAYKTNVTLNSGTINGSLYGGGLGDASAQANVYGPVQVTVNGGSLNIGGVFGCNNQNGSPQSTVKVTVNHTDPSEWDSAGKNITKYAINAVYGGGNQIAFAGKPVVEIMSCDCSIKEVYGGGNAADVGNDAENTNPHNDATDVTIHGGEIDYAFGGGNGKGDGNPGANVKGNANLMILGGTINNIFGGSNTLGDVYGTATVTLDDQNDECPITAQEVYGGANEAPMTGTPELKLVCLKNRLGKVYGGARAVDINSDVTLTITGGEYGQVFGGNNVSGNIKGKITVNIDETGCSPIKIDELYCGGDKAHYSVYGYNTDGTPKTSGNKYDDPTINVISCTRIGKVFGGGYGAEAIMYGDPHVNINLINGAHSASVSNRWNNKLGTIGDVYGGGNAAKVVGDTYVNIGTKTTVLRADGTTNAPVLGVNISGNVYGGGNAADVTGKTNVTVGR